MIAGRMALGILVALEVAAGCHRGPAPAEPVKVIVTKNGWEPWKIPARKGEKLVLLVTRTTDETCATELMIPEAGVNVPLPLGKEVRIELTPERTGPLRFSCAMKMFQGVIEVR
jgi:plastocyanin domain-containing protein